MSGLSCGMQYLHCGLRDLLLRRSGFSLIVARRLSCPAACGILVAQPGLEPASPALEGGFLTTAPPGESPILIFIFIFIICSCVFPINTLRARTRVYSSMYSLKQLIRYLPSILYMLNKYLWNQKGKKSWFPNPPLSIQFLQCPLKNKPTLLLDIYMCLGVW